jgi:hypothetical protein
MSPENQGIFQFLKKVIILRFLASIRRSGFSAGWNPN